MDKGTNAFGILFELLGLAKAAKEVRALSNGLDGVAQSETDAAKASVAFDDTLKKEKVSRIRQAGGAVLSLGNSMLTGAGDTKSLVASVSSLVGSIPVIGPMIEKTSGFMFTMLKKAGELRDAQNSWMITTGGNEDALKALTPAIRAAGDSTGTSSVKVLQITKAMGMQTEAGVALTHQSLEMTRAFGMVSEESLAMTKSMNALGMASLDVKKFSGEVLRLQQQFDLPEMMSDLPKLVEGVRMSSLMLGANFKDKLGPSTVGVAKAAGVLSKQLGMMPKQAMKVATDMLSQFQGLALNLDSVFTGVDDDFDDKTKKLMEMFARSGHGVEAGFEAIRKASEGDFKDIGASFKDVLMQGGDGAKRMRLLLQKSFGPQFTEVLKSLGEDGEKMYEKMFPKPKDVAKPEDLFDKSIQKMVESAGSLETKLNRMANKFLEGFVENSPKAAEQIEKMFQQMFDKGNTIQQGLDKMFQGMDDPMAALLKVFRKDAIEPLLKGIGDKLTEWFGPNFSTLGEKLKEGAKAFTEAVDTFRAIQNGFRDVVAKFIPGVKTTAQMAEEDSRSSAGNERQVRFQTEKDPATRAKLRAALDTIEDSEKKLSELKMKRATELQAAFTGSQGRGDNQRVQWAAPAGPPTRIQLDIASTELNLAGAIQIFAAQKQSDAAAQVAGR
jgi:hypothetical protein